VQDVVVRGGTFINCTFHNCTFESAVIQGGSLEHPASPVANTSEHGRVDTANSGHGKHRAINDERSQSDIGRTECEGFDRY